MGDLVTVWDVFCLVYFFSSDIFLIYSIIFFSREFSFFFTLFVAVCNSVVYSRCLIPRKIVRVFFCVCEFFLCISQGRRIVNMFV